MCPKEKIKEMERRRDEIMMAMPVKAKELTALTEKLAGNNDELGRLEERLSGQVRKIEQQSVFNFATGWRSPSTVQTQEQEKVDLVDLQKEAAALDAELAANEREREELKAAWHAKCEECEELSKEHKSLLNTAQLYLLPN
jgi:hypothetical protein